jgi:hypothetical protein
MRVCGTGGGCIFKCALLPFPPAFSLALAAALFSVPAHGSGKVSSADPSFIDTTIPPSIPSEIIADWKFKDGVDSNFSAAIIKIKSSLPSRYASKIDTGSAEALYLRACHFRRVSRLSPFSAQLKMLLCARHYDEGAYGGTIGAFDRGKLPGGRGTAGGLKFQVRFSRLSHRLVLNLPSAGSVALVDLQGRRILTIDISANDYFSCRGTACRALGVGVPAGLYIARFKGRRVSVETTVFVP